MSGESQAAGGYLVNNVWQLHADLSEIEDLGGAWTTAAAWLRKAAKVVVQKEKIVYHGDNAAGQPADWSGDDADAHHEWLESQNDKIGAVAQAMSDIGHLLNGGLQGSRISVYTSVLETQTGLDESYSKLARGRPPQSNAVRFPEDQKGDVDRQYRAAIALLRRLTDDLAMLTLDLQTQAKRFSQ